MQNVSFAVSETVSETVSRAAEVIPISQPKKPVAGLLALSDMPEREPLRAWYSGFPEWRRKMMVAPGTLSVCTGHPGHGKTAMMGNLWFNTVGAQDLGIVIATFETGPIPAYRKMLRQFWAACPQDQMTDQQIRDADEFIEDHYRFLVHPEERPTIEWILEWTVKAEKFDVLVIDPWNRLESQRGKDETETEYIAYVLRTLHVFAKQHNCHVQVIAHPAKRDVKFRDRVPSLEDISGSKNWDNMPDQGFAVHREQFWDESTRQRRYEAKLFHLKSRFEELGHPIVFDMRLNPKTWRFECVGQ